MSVSDKGTVFTVNQGGTADSFIRPWQRGIFLPRTFLYSVSDIRRLLLGLENDGSANDILKKNNKSGRKGYKNEL